MNTENICKFSEIRSSDLICASFIRENGNAQAEGVIAKHNAVHLVIEGSGVFVRGGIEQSLARGTLFFVTEGERFAVRGEGNFSYLYITFFGRRAEELLLRFGIGEGSGVYAGYEEMIPFWDSCQHSAREENIDVLCESVLLYSLAKLRPAKKEKNDAVASIVSITQKCFTDARLSLPRIAAEIGYDPKYLSSLFKRKKEIAYTQYLRELRIKHAIFLMEQGVVSIKNIALLSGFGDALYFSKVFAESMGMSPKQYIQNKIGEEK